MSGDGCNNECKVETDWACSGGNSTTPDSCISLIGPEIEFTYLNRKSYLGSMALTENVTFGEIAEGDISVEINGPLAPYEFTFLIDSSTGYIAGEVGDHIKIQFAFLSSLAGLNQGNSNS